MKKQKQKQNHKAIDDELIAIKRNKVEIWQQSEDRAKQYLMTARKKRIQAQRELRKLEN